ncbi:MAG: prepilin-type N-terminal cleavage/methylation domain-containing protein [Pseudomonadota bacterium]
MRTKQKGFTLLELISAIAIAGIFAAWAFPSYIDHFQGAKSSEILPSALKEYVSKDGSVGAASNDSTNLIIAKPSLWSKISCMMDEGSLALVVMSDTTTKIWSCTSNPTDKLNKAPAFKLHD